MVSIFSKAILHSWYFQEAAKSQLIFPPVSFKPPSFSNVSKTESPLQLLRSFPLLDSETGIFVLNLMVLVLTPKALVRWDIAVATLPLYSAQLEEIFWFHFNQAM